MYLLKPNGVNGLIRVSGYPFVEYLRWLRISEWNGADSRVFISFIDRMGKEMPGHWSCLR